jgi:hypothetical protein
MCQQRLLLRLRLVDQRTAVAVGCSDEAGGHVGAEKRCSRRAVRRLPSACRPVPAALSAATMPAPPPTTHPINRSVSPSSWGTLGRTHPPHRAAGRHHRLRTEPISLRIYQKVWIRGLLLKARPSSSITVPFPTAVRRDLPIRARPTGDCLTLEGLRL